jgi:hypothetical protein
MPTFVHSVTLGFQVILRFLGAVLGWDVAHLCSIQFPIITGI